MTKIGLADWYQARRKGKSEKLISRQRVGKERERRAGLLVEGPEDHRGEEIDADGGEAPGIWVLL